MFKNEIKYYIKLLNESTSRFFFNCKHFGIKVGFFNFIGELSEFQLIKNYNFAITLRKKQHYQVYNILVNKYSDIIEEYKYKKIEVGDVNKTIWCFWWQGIENAPPLVQKCVKSIEKYSDNYDLIIIDKNNYLDYTNIHPEIIKKLKNNQISITHFSDILRTNLLSLHGGVWVDATLFVCDYIFKEFDDVTFNTASRIGKWAVFFMGGKSNKLFSFLQDFLIKYTIEHDKFINYFLMDYIIEIAYNSFDECKEYIDNANLKNLGVFYFLDNFSKTYVAKDFEDICNKYKFFKLSYKPSQNHKIYDENENLTNFGYFMEKF